MIDIPGGCGTSAPRPERIQFLGAAENPLDVDALAMMSEPGGVLSLCCLSCSSRAADSMYGAGCKSLELTTSVPHISGSLDLVLENAEGSFAIVVFGGTAVDLGFSLAGHGAPDCYMHTSGDLRCYTQPVTAGSASSSIAMLLTPAVVGCEVAVLAAAYTQHNVIGLATSNGVFARVDL